MNAYTGAGLAAGIALATLSGCTGTERDTTRPPAAAADHAAPMPRVHDGSGQGRVDGRGYEDRACANPVSTLYIGRIGVRYTEPAGELMNPVEAAAVRNEAANHVVDERKYAKLEGRTVTVWAFSTALMNQDQMNRTDSDGRAGELLSLSEARALADTVRRTSQANEDFNVYPSQSSHDFYEQPYTRPVNGEVEIVVLAQDACEPPAEPTPVPSGSSEDLSAVV